jgi:lipopolysaccharide/colanic/teichoic acid biosynthesis glycosyltransferase
MSAWLRGRLLGDRVIAAIAAVVLSPIMAVLAVAIRRGDGGPAFISVPRIGRGGRQFRMWKMRSMRADGPDGRADGPSLTHEHDDRITPVGRTMRAYHLDELPQLYNVVRGEMLLLGPRPEAPEFVDLDDPLWRSLLVIPPGIAGPTQVIVGDWERTLIDHADDNSIYRTKVLPVKLAIDEWYLENCSIVTDSLVALTLLRRFLPGTESTTLKSRVFAAVPPSGVVREFLSERRRTQAAAAAATSN